ncbi:MAG TPA: hypothetical protein VH877_27535 [Polyangia bacterium]|nr:hypothetical protein [Polyangia bacterium]
MKNISNLPCHRSRFFRAIFAALPLVAGSLVVSGGPVEADEGKQITGKFHMGLVIGADCPAASQVCATGSVTGDLAGQIFITIDDLTETHDQRGEVVSLLSGDVLINTAEGDIHGKLRGIYDQATGQMRSTITLIGGDRRYHKMNGKLHVSGAVDLRNNVEEDDYRGELGR